MRLLMIGLILTALVLCVAGCGGGNTSPVAGSRQAVSKVLLPADQTVGGIQFTLNIPYGVTAQTDSSGNVTSSAADLVGASGNYQIIRSYTPATPSANGGLTIAILEPAGFTAGQYIAISLDITPGVTPNAADFTLSNLVLSDLNGRTVTGVTCQYTVDIT